MLRLLLGAWFLEDDGDCLGGSTMADSSTSLFSSIIEVPSRGSSVESPPGGGGSPISSP